MATQPNRAKSNDAGVQVFSHEVLVKHGNRYTTERVMASSKAEAERIVAAMLAKPETVEPEVVEVRDQSDLLAHEVEQQQRRIEARDEAAELAKGDRQVEPDN